jgi:signal transduction histidine kinase
MATRLVERATAARLLLSGALGRLTQNSRRFQALLDMCAIAGVVATFAQLGDPDLLLHVVWVVLAITAFFFGLQSTLLRVFLATGALVVYAGYAHFSVVLFPGHELPHAQQLELTEWPLMFTISLIVAVMADRRAGLAAHYATLYRRTNDRLLTAQEDERRRLAYDLHDGVGQTLTALTLSLDAVSARLAKGDPMARRVERARKLAAGALAETRDVATRLRPARLAQIGLPGALRELARSAGVRVEMRLGVDPETAAAQTAGAAIEIYRIVQEALANAARHSKADKVEIDFRPLPNGLRIEIADDGIGFDVTVKEPLGLGLAGMRDRARVLGASLVVESHPGAGTRVVLDLPTGRARLVGPIDSTPGEASTPAAVARLRP